MQILIDGSWFSYRAQLSHTGLTTEDGRPTGLVYGFLRSLFALRKRFKEADFFIAWDDAPRRKKKIYPDYKANRVKGKSFTEEIVPQREILHSFLTALGVAQGFVQDEEADDVIGSSLSAETLNIIVSSDRDFLQLVESDKVQQLCLKTGKNPEKMYTEEDVLAEYGVTGDEFVLWKVFRGDGSDNLPGVKRLPTDRVVRLAKYGSIEAAYKSPFPGFTTNQHKAVQAFREQAEINLELMKIKRDLDVDVTSGSFNRDAFTGLCDELEMHSLKKDVDLFKPSS